MALITPEDYLELERAAETKVNITAAKC